MPGTVDLYCDSALHLIARPPNDHAAQTLAASGFCVGGEPGAVLGLERACLVRRELYAVEPCAGSSPGLGVRLLMSDDEASAGFYGSELFVRLKLRQPIEGGVVEFLSTN